MHRVMMWFENLWALLPLLLPLLGVFTHGKNTVVKLDNGAGSLTDITAYLSSASLERVRDMAETTVFGLNEKTYIAGLRDATFSGEGRFDPTVDLILNDDLADNAATKTLEYGPEGGTTGKVKYSVECWVTNYSHDSPMDDAAGISFELQATGVVTRGTFS
jgi:hypothetical protein